LILALLVLVADFVLEQAALAQVGPSWVSTGSPNIPRSDHTATLLPNGEVLIAGGFWDAIGFHETAELYDPTTGTWNFTGSLNAFRSDHTATLLPNGTVLVAGGATVWNLPVESAELYDSATERWNDTGSLVAARYGHTATLLQNGKVLVAGGTDDPELFSFLASAELYDPATGKWDETGDLSRERYQHTATLLPNGKVLVAGGYSWSSLSLNGAELYDPTTGKWSGTGNLSTERAGHTATLLPNGKVLVAGGYNFAGNRLNTVNSAEVYDPATGSWSITSNLNTARTDHTATLLPNGKVLVAGGYIYGSWPPISLNSAELYDPATGTWSVTANRNIPRRAHTAILLTNGNVLAAGGDNQGAIQSAELYNSSSPLIAAVLPGSRSVQIGTPATAFATIINTGQAAVSGCAISPITNVPASFTYQTTSLATNQVTGSPNTPVDIPAGAAQSFVLALTPTATIAPTDVQLSFDCGNTEPAPIISGLNTFLFSASASPAPDLVALAATVTGDGIVNIPGTNGTGVFTVATVNLGAGGALTVSADTGSAILPVNILICQTDPGTAACLSPPASSVTTTILSNETPTFGVFVAAGGNVSFDPATNRIFVRFKDNGSFTRGSTSVAVRTQ
jgi:N-acetylneuraminic acid mutarotase